MHERAHEVRNDDVDIDIQRRKGRLVARRFFSFFSSSFLVSSGSVSFAVESRRDDASS